MAASSGGDPRLVAAILALAGLRVVLAADIVVVRIVTGVGVVLLVLAIGLESRRRSR